MDNIYASADALVRIVNDYEANDNVNRDDVGKYLRDLDAIDSQYSFSFDSKGDLVMPQEPDVKQPE